MTHWRTLQERDYMGVWDLLVDGKPRDRTVLIEKVDTAPIKSKSTPKGKRKITLHFKGCQKPLIVNMTIGEVLEGMFGEDVEQWVGQKVTLYAARTRNASGGKPVPCVRVRPKPATGEPEQMGAGNPVDPKLREEQNAAYDEPREPGVD